MTTSVADDEMTEAEAEAILTASLEAEETVQAPPVDPEAPFGRFANGKPRRSPPKSARMAAAPPTAPRKTTPKPRGGKPSYGERIAEALKFPAAILALVGNARGSEALVADAATVTLYGPQAGDALGGLAEKKPEVAAALDKILSAGPYGEIAATFMIMGLQIAANHKLMAPVSSMGIMSPEEIMTAVAQA